MGLKQNYDDLAKDPGETNDLAERYPEKSELPKKNVAGMASLHATGQRISLGLSLNTFYP